MTGEFIIEMFCPVAAGYLELGAWNNASTLASLTEHVFYHLTFITATYIMDDCHYFSAIIGKNSGLLYNK